ncbi:MAG: CPBP family intramembrane metalloprotease [Candidatus Hydrogenedentes bacterium]|nr:CPBP family intramembrane metalloprotease [Candidatus Hydrogenedentota bacterium]
MTDPVIQFQPTLQTGRRTLLKVATLVEGGMLLVALGLGWFLEEPWWTGARADGVSLASGAIAGAIMLAAAGAFMELNLPFTIQMRRDIDRLSGLFRDATLLDFLYISVLAGAGEEALFRGLVQTGMAAHLGLPLAIAASALVFGLVHNISRPYVVFTAVLGAFFSGLFVWSDNIVVPATAHGAYDFIALCYMRHGASKNRKD